MLSRITLTIAAAFVVSAPLAASGGLAFFGIVERVVFEPTEQNAERVQLWGVFAYVDPQAAKPGSTGPVSAAARGYLYFRVRSSFPGFTTERQVEITRREWMDLKAIAGTGQAVGFGSWGYIGSFGQIDPRKAGSGLPFLYEDKPQGGERADLRVRPDTEPPANPATYQTETGIVKLSDTGSHAAVVKLLRAAQQR
jgi:hypothetical protein